MPVPYRNGHFNGNPAQLRADSDAATVTHFLHRVISLIEDVHRKPASLRESAEARRQLLNRIPRTTSPHDLRNRNLRSLMVCRTTFDLYQLALQPGAAARN